MKVRLKSLKIIAPFARRIIVRLQPYIMEYHSQILNNIKRLKGAGVYGVVIEGIKMQKKLPGLVKIGADFCYPKRLLKQKFIEIKDECRKHGLAFYCGENRLRYIGDSLTCCGVDGLEDFKPNNANLNHYLFDKENYKFTNKMSEKATSYCFKGILQKAGLSKVFKKSSYKDLMTLCENDKEKIKIFLGEDLG